MNRAAQLAIVWALGGTGCHRESALEPDVLPPDGVIAVDFRTDQLQYRIGATTAKTMMINRSTSTLTMGVCNDVLELQVTGGWHEIPRGQEACITLAIIIAPGDSATLALNLQPATEQGTYRVRRQFTATQGGSATTMYKRTGTFTMVR